MADRKNGFFVDLLDGTFSLMSRTWLTSLILGGVLFIPTSFFFGWAYDRFLPAMERLSSSLMEEPGGVLVTLGLAYLWIFLALLAQGFVYLFVRACVTEHASRAVRGESASTFTIITHVLTTKYARLIGQRALQMAIIGIAFAAVCVVAGLFAALFGVLKSPTGAVLVVSLFVLAGVAVVMWLAVLYIVTLESVVIDGTGIDASIDHSMALVRRRWWRVFGYTLLFSLMVSFASSLIATPIMFFSNIRQFIHTMESLVRESGGSRSFNSFGSVFRELMAGIGKRLGILQYVESVLGCFVTPVFMTLLFLELKKRPVPGKTPAAAPVLEPVSAPPEATP